MALDVCDLYRFSYENIISLEEAAILNFQITAVFDFQMVTKSLIFTHWLKLISKNVLIRLVY